jgi:membrane peptidoglycan carboxypeptidase
VDEGKGWQPVRPPAPKSRVTLKPETIAALHDGLYLVVNGAGTGGRARIPGKDVSGKTGTAQVISLQGGRKAAGRTERDLRDHGWFVFFAPRDNPEIAGVIFGEHNEHGATSAPIAKHVLETYFNKKDHLPLPKLTMPGPEPNLERDEPPLQDPATIAEAEPRRSAHAQAGTDARTTSVPPSRLAAHRRDTVPVVDWRRDDLQHHRWLEAAGRPAHHLGAVPS